jgi:DNA-binding NtrC family response regulator
MAPRETSKVLIADREPAILRTLATFLKLRGFECFTVQSAAEAYLWLSENSAHILLVDVDAEGMDCTKLLDLLRKKGDFSQVIAMSARATVDSTISAFNCGVSDFITKPFQNLAEVETAAVQAAERLNRWRNVLLKALSEEGRL